RTDGTVVETVDARALMKDIAAAAWECADPGVQYDTTINAWHTSPNTGRINASNPCSEYMHIDDSACNLASLNLMKFRREDGEFDVEMFEHAVDVVLLAQEIAVGYSSYPTPEIGRNAKRFRQLGLGYANLGALLMARGLPYDSDEGRAYAAAITALMTGRAYRKSAQAAQRMGAHEGYQENRASMVGVIAKHRAAVGNIDHSESVPEDLAAGARRAWDEALEIGEVHGFRNAQATVLAPTGTISFMMDCDTTGVEPDFSLVKSKKLVGGGEITIVNKTVPMALRERGYAPREVEEIVAYIDERGGVVGAPHLKTEHYPIFDCAIGERAIHYMGHVKMMGAVQPFISGAISKTVNLPEAATVDDVMDAYIEAWKHGVKAIAIYRDGSKKVQPLSTRTETSNSVRSGPASPAPNEPLTRERIVEVARPRRRLADTRASLTHKFTIEGHEGYITVGLFDDGTPGEIFVTMAKEGSTLSGMMDSFATSVSLLFQYGVPLTHLVEKFGHMRFEPSGWTGNPEIGFAKSIVDYVFRWLGHRFLSAEDKMTAGLVRQTDIVSDPAPQLELMHKIVAQAPVSDAGPGPRRLNSTPDAPPCPRCGWLTVRNGTCHKCENCGETTGCS
nr:vitamin B12-dependent ribonucleotide reductase [Chloroflexota bacterium]